MKKKTTDIDSIIYMRSIRDRTSKNRAWYFNNICRWFSKTFYTPLHEVYKLDYAFIMQHFYDEMINQQSDDELKNKILPDVISEIKEKKDIEYDKYVYFDQEKNESAFFKHLLNKAKKKTKNNKMDREQKETEEFLNSFETTYEDEDLSDD